MERSSAECTEVSKYWVLVREWAFLYNFCRICNHWARLHTFTSSSTINQASSGLAPIFINQAPSTRLHQPFIQSIIGGLSFIDFILFIPLTFSLGLYTDEFLPDLPRPHLRRTHKCHYISRGLSLVYRAFMISIHDLLLYSSMTTSPVLHSSYLL